MTENSFLRCRVLGNAIVYWPVAFSSLSCLLFSEPIDTTVWLIENYSSNLTWLINCLWLPLVVGLMRDTTQGHNLRDQAQIPEESKTRFGCLMVVFALIYQAVVMTTSIGAIKYIYPEWVSNKEVGAEMMDEWVLLPNIWVIVAGLLLSAMMYLLTNHGNYCLALIMMVLWKRD